MKAFILFLIIFTFSSVNAENVKTDDCTAVNETAKAIMEARQAGLEKENAQSSIKSAKNISSELFTAMIDDAYKMKKQDDMDMGRDTVADFQSKWFHLCRAGDL